MASINETIATITKEYLKPKYPIYKIDAVNSEIIFDADDEPSIQVMRQITLWMLDDDLNWERNDKCSWEQYDYPTKKCSTKYIEYCTRNITEPDGTRTTNCHERIKVISCERIA